MEKPAAGYSRTLQAPSSNSETAAAGTTKHQAQLPCQPQRTRSNSATSGHAYGSPRPTGLHFPEVSELSSGQNLFLYARFVAYTPLWTVLHREAPPVLDPGISYLSCFVHMPFRSTEIPRREPLRRKATWPRRILGAAVLAQAQIYAGAGGFISAQFSSVVRRSGLLGRGGPLVTRPSAQGLTLTTFRVLQPFESFGRGKERREGPSV